METFSVGIPVHNEEKNIERILRFLFSEKFSIVLDRVYVVASGCTDRSVEILKKMKKKHTKITLIVEPRRAGKSSAINRILSINRSEIVVLLNADTFPSRNSIGKLVDSIRKGGFNIVFSRNFFSGRNKSFVSFLYNFVWRLHDRWCQKLPKVSGELVAMKGSAIEKIPPNIINDDAYISAIARKRNLRIKYARDVKLEIIEKLSLATYIRKRRRIARGYMQLTSMGLNVSIPVSLAIKLILQEIFEQPEEFLRIMAAVFLEICINTLAFYDTLCNRTPYIWER